MRDKHSLVVLDFDGFLVNSYEIMRATFEQFGLDLGDEERFKQRRKFLKYIGGGKEILRNLVSYSLPKKRKFREVLTDEFVNTGRVYPAFAPFVNRLVADPAVHVGVVSRNFALRPGTTIRAVMASSGIDEQHLDFVVPIPIGASKVDVLQGMRGGRLERAVLGADEISDFKAAAETGYEPVIGCYGFDRHARLTKKGGIPEHLIAATPEDAVELLSRALAPSS
jgi:hypothetical protein